MVVVLRFFSVAEEAILPFRHLLFPFPKNLVPFTKILLYATKHLLLFPQSILAEFVVGLCSI
jgi:hypothetical protein